MGGHPRHHGSFRRCLFCGQLFRIDLGSKTVAALGTIYCENGAPGKFSSLTRGPDCYYAHGGRRIYKIDPKTLIAKQLTVLPWPVHGTAYGPDRAVAFERP